MKKTCKFFKLTIIIFFALIFTINIKVSAQDIYKTFDAKYDILQDKIWTIRLNDNVDPSTINNKNIKVLDGTNSEASISVSYNDAEKSITVKPNTNYVPSKTYTLYISNLMSKAGSNLKNPVKMSFTIKKDNPPVSQFFNTVDEHTYEITDTITLTSDASSNYDLTYNIGSPSNSPYQQESDLKVYGPSAQINTLENGAKQLTASSQIDSSSDVQYKIVRTVKNSGIKYNVNLSSTSGNYSGFSDYAKYISPEDKIQSSNPEIVNKSKELFSGITNPYYKAKKAFEFVNNYMTYDYDYGNQGALSALETGRGVCEDYSELFTALLRASGVPARVATGFRTSTSDFSASSIDADNGYRHAWPEFYLPEYGWIVVEPTFTYYCNGVKTIDYDYFANMSESSHILVGYNIDGDNTDDSVYISFYGGTINMDCKTIIRMLN